MSDTPRTDVLLIAHDMAPTHISLISHARELERELNAANDRIKRLEEENNELLSEEARLLNTNGELERRIKRLEEALEGTVKWIVHLADSGDAGFWDVEKQSEIIAARAALKKESKP